MTADLTAEQIRRAVGAVFHAYGGLPAASDLHRCVMAALAYADLLDRIASGDTIRIDKVNGEWPEWANRVIDAWREGETKNLLDELAKGDQG